MLSGTVNFPASRPSFLFPSGLWTTRSTNGRLFFCDDDLFTPINERHQLGEVCFCLWNIDDLHSAFTPWVQIYIDQLYQNRPSWSIIIFEVGHLVLDAAHGLGPEVFRPLWLSGGRSLLRRRVINPFATLKFYHVHPLVVVPFNCQDLPAGSEAIHALSRRDRWVLLT